MLTDYDQGDDGHCTVPESQKSNLRMSDSMIDGNEKILNPLSRRYDTFSFNRCSNQIN